MEGRPWHDKIAVVLLASHIIFTAYGFWLPNDRRGSWSTLVRSPIRAQSGDATKVDHTHSVATRPHDRSQRFVAKAALARPPVRFTGVQCQAIGAGFAQYVQRSHCALHACAILPMHSHLGIARMTYAIEQTANLLKRAASAELSRRNLHPFQEETYANGKRPSPWSRHQWSVFLYDTADVHRSIAYVNNNPLKENKPPPALVFRHPVLREVKSPT